MGMVSDYGYEHETVLRRSAATIFDDRCAIDSRMPRRFTYENSRCISAHSFGRFDVSGCRMSEFTPATSVPVKASNKSII